MKRPLGRLPALICASVLLLGHICLGQSAAPPPQTPPASSGPVVVGEKPAIEPAANMDLAFHPDPKNPPAETKKSDPAGASAAIPPKSSQQTSARDASAAYTAPGKPYVIGPLDVIEIKVWNDQNLSGIFDVGPDGMISMPLLGEIRADGMTKQDLMKALHDKLASTVFTEESAPEVTVQLLRVNSKKYYVMGGVNRPGEYPLVGVVTVLDAFANTGGFHDFAKTTKIFILRGDQKIPFNYKDVSHGRNMKQNIEIQNGDHIFVPE